MKEKTMSVYILTNTRHTTLYVGVTNNLPRRMIEHKLQMNKKSFTAKYNLTKLVYYSTSDHASGAIDEEKRIKDLSEELDITEELLDGIKREQSKETRLLRRPPPKTPRLLAMTRKVHGIASPLVQG